MTDDPTPTCHRIPPAMRARYTRMEDKLIKECIAPAVTIASPDSKPSLIRSTNAAQAGA